jgi:hypothetical protein
MELDVKSLPEDIADLWIRFEGWRSAKSGRGRIPDELWEEAVELARKYGVSRISATLRLSYNGLRSRLKPNRLPGKPSRSSSLETPAFIEIGDMSTPGLFHCRLELENGAGSKLRIRMQGNPSFDLVALSRVFFGDQS